MYSSKTIKTMIVEDDKMVMKVLTEFVEKIPELICSEKAMSVQEAKVLLERKTIDLLLLDVYLPDGNGLDLLKWTRINEINVDAIMITADHRMSSIEKATRFGMIDYIVKPFKFERFESSIRRYINKKNMLLKHEEGNQDVIDNYVGIQNDEDNGLWKNQTYHNIIEYLKEHDDASFTSSQIAAALGISRITARRYLESMENSGAVVMTLSYGKIGRPQNTYSFGGK